LYQVASVKQEWNNIKVFPDLSGTGDDCSRFDADFELLLVPSIEMLDCRMLQHFSLQPVSGVPE